MPDEQQMDVRKWVAVAGTMLGAFMAVLDIQITNASLNDISGGISVTPDEGSWISTSYLIGEIITIPLTAWMMRIFTIRYYLLVNVVLFLGFSALCGVSTNLTEMIVFRAGQGFTGGVFIPTALTVIVTYMPKNLQGVGQAMFGITATLAPAVGPYIGGVLTDTVGWEWNFYINFIPGIIMFATVLGDHPGREDQPQAAQGGRLDRHRLDGHRSGRAHCHVGGGPAQGLVRQRFHPRLAGILAGDFRADVPHPRVHGGKAARQTAADRQPQPRVFPRWLPSCWEWRSTAPSTSSRSYLGQVQGYSPTLIGETLIWVGLPQLLIFPVPAVPAQEGRHPRAGVFRLDPLRGELLHELVHESRLRQGSVHRGEHRACFRSAVYHRAGDGPGHGHARARGRRRRLGHLQHVPQPWAAAWGSPFWTPSPPAANSSTTGASANG